MLKRNDTAPFDILTYFEGTTHASGIFEDRSGNTRRRFTVEMTGTAHGEMLVLEEHFLFDDGERQQRTWRFTRDGFRFTGTCEDAAAEAHRRHAEGIGGGADEGPATDRVTMPSPWGGHHGMRHR